jgi:sec-independent protein translocase protein TatB
MFNIGTWELVVIVALALIILGPKQLPQVARSLGKTLARLRHSLEEAKREMGLDELKRQIESETIEEGELEELQQLLDVRAQVRQALEQLPEHPRPQAAEEAGPVAGSNLNRPGG